MEREPGYSRRFVFGPLERRGVAGGLRAGQLLLLGTGALGAVVAFRIAPTGGGLFAGMLLVLLGGLVAFIPIRGRTLEQWAPVLGTYLRRRVNGDLGYRSRQPTLGISAALGGDGARREPDLPGSLASCELLAIPVGAGHEVGVFARIVTAELPPAREHLRERRLHEILSVFMRSAHRPRDAEEAIDVIAEGFRAQVRSHRAGASRIRRRPAGIRRGRRC
jgi:hypothetical protein